MSPSISGPLLVSAASVGRIDKTSTGAKVVQLMKTKGQWWALGPFWQYITRAGGDNYGNHWTNILTMRPIMRKIMAKTIMAISMILMMAMMIIRGTTWLFLTSVDGWPKSCLSYTTTICLETRRIRQTNKGQRQGKLTKELPALHHEE